MPAPDDRYSRQTRFVPLGEAGQARIHSARVVIIGCGALGTVQAEILARAGVGHLRIVDRDFVEYSNLQRQFLFDENDARDSLPKAVAAARRLTQVNTTITIEPIVADLTAANYEDIFEDADLILDGTDNFETRFLMNDAAVEANIPWIYGAAVGSYGIKMAIDPGRTACLRCVYPEPPQGSQPTCETDGVLAPITAIIGALETADVLKCLSQGRESVDGKITTIDIWTGALRQIAAPLRDENCPCCAQRQFVYLDGSRRAPISLCGRNAVQIHERSRPVNLADLANRLRALAPVRVNDFALRLEIDGYELTVFPDGRAIIKGTTDSGVARSVYAKYIGT